MTKDTCEASCSLPMGYNPAQIMTSYPLMYGGALLSSFGLFMLSLCRPEQFYQIQSLALFHALSD
jgi:hypothetical protein